VKQRDVLRVALTMMRLAAVVVLLLVTWPAAAWMPARLEEEVLLDVKAALDPHGEALVSWQAGGRPCTGAFEGVLCDSGDNLVRSHCRQTDGSAFSLRKREGIF
jgi:hypothetical protein